MQNIDDFNVSFTDAVIDVVFFGSNAVVTLFDLTAIFALLRILSGLTHGVAKHG